MTNHPAYAAGFAAMNALIAEVGFAAARDQFNLDNPRDIEYGSTAGLMYARGERDALVEAIPAEPVETTALDAKSARRIAALINTISVATNMEQARDENGERTYDFWLWHSDKCRATVALADEFGIELPNLSRDRQYLADYPTDPKHLS